MNSDFLNKVNKNKELLYLITALVGYIVISSLSNIFEVESRDFAVPYRFFIFFFSVYIFSKYIYYRKSELKTVIILCAFWLLYFFKALYSFNVDHYLPEIVKLKHEVYTRIFIINLFPSLALLSIDYEKVDFKKNN